MSVIRPLMVQEHRQISIRLGAIRRFHRRSQDEIAKAAHLTRDQLSNIETGRTDLKFEVGWNLCRELNIDPWYLATGQPPQSPFPDINIDHILPVEEHLSFRDICLMQLQEDLLTARNATSHTARASKLSGRSGETKALINSFFEGLSEDLRQRLALQLTEAFEAFIHEISKTQPRKDLMDASTGAIIREVKSPLKSLLSRLNRYTSEEGKKTELANYLGVPLETVSRWLSGKREPGGENALRLLQWVEQQEHQ